MLAFQTMLRKRRRLIELIGMVERKERQTIERARLLSGRRAATPTAHIRAARERIR